MKYRVKCDLFFSNESDANTVFNAISLSENKCININSDKTMESKSNFEYHKCYHDEIPSKTCEIIKKTTLNDGKLTKINNAIKL